MVQNTRVFIICRGENSTGLLSTALAATAPLGGRGFTSSIAISKMLAPCRMPKVRKACS